MKKLLEADVNRLEHGLLEGGSRAGLDDLAGGLGLEDALLAGEGVDTLASRLGGKLLHGELGEAGEDEDAALLHLEGADGLVGFHGAAGFLAGETGEGDHVVKEFTLGHLGALGGGDGAGGGLLQNRQHEHGL